MVPRSVSQDLFYYIYLNAMCLYCRSIILQLKQYMVILVYLDIYPYYNDAALLLFYMENI